MLATGRSGCDPIGYCPVGKRLQDPPQTKLRRSVGKSRGFLPYSDGPALQRFPSLLAEARQAAARAAGDCTARRRRIFPKLAREPATALELPASNPKAWYQSYVRVGTAMPVYAGQLPFACTCPCEAARGMSTAPSMNRTAAWFGVKFLLDMLPAQDRAYQAYPFCFRSCFATSGGLKSEVCECVLCVHASTCVVIVSRWTLQKHLILPQLLKRGSKNERRAADHCLRCNRVQT